MKMVQYHRIPTVATVILLLLLQTPLEAKKTKRKICPIGFQIAYTRTKEDPICYRLKGPEKLSDTFLGCTGNLYTSKLYNILNITKPELILWTEFKSFYPGGPFIDSSYTKSTGSLFGTSFDVNNSQRNFEEELCVVIDPIGNFTTVSCDEEYHRYCLVEPYPDENDMSRDGCEYFRDSWRFWSPKATCLSPATAVGGGAIRATWTQAEEICERRNGTVLYNGWRYSNNPLLHVSGAVPIFPLSVTYNPDESRILVNGKQEMLWQCIWSPYISRMLAHKTLEYELVHCCWLNYSQAQSPCTPSTVKHKDAEVVKPPSEWGFDPTSVQNGTSYGIVRNGQWDLVNSTYIFYDVICEKNIELITPELVVGVDEQARLTLTINAKLDKSDIHCFSDSESFHPSSVDISSDGYNNIVYKYIIKPIASGYYWCLNIDSKNYHVSKSNNYLWLREEQSLRFSYAVKIRSSTEYRFETVDKQKKIWEKKLKEYIYYSTSYYNVTGDRPESQDPLTVESILREFKSSRPELSPRGKDVIYDLKLKKLFMDGQTALLHIQLDPRMRPVQPGTWNDMEIKYMKPVHYCSVEGQQFVDSLTVACETHSCSGNFNDGVQVVTRIKEGCDTTEVSRVTQIMPMIPASTSEASHDVLLNDNTSDSSEENSETTTESTTTELFTEETTDYTHTVSVVDEVWTTTEVILTYPKPPRPPTTTTERPTIGPPPTPPPPQEQLQQVMEDLDILLSNDSAIVVVETINDAFDQVDELLAENIELDIPSELLHLLDRIGSRIYLNGSDNVTAVRENIALLVADADPVLPVKGLRIAARDNDMFTDDAFEIIRDEVNSTHLSSVDSEAVVELPDSVATSNSRISFVAFRNDRAFHSPNNLYFINSRILSVNVHNLTQFDTGEYVDIHFSSLRGDLDDNTSRACVFWEFEEDGSGYWSQEGCTFIPATQAGQLDTCRCDHLTHFAEILVPRTDFGNTNETILEVIAIIGCVLSLFGLIMIGITAALFRSWRREFSNKIWLQLCIAIFILVICFLIVALVKFDTYDIPCMLVGVVLHYSVLASFCWMLVAAILSYRRLVMVFTRDASHKLLKASAFSWGVPCAVVGILLSVDPHSYAGQFEESMPTAFCYPSGLGLWLGVYAPIVVMLLANWTLFILIVRSVFASKRIQRHGDSNEALRCASVSCLLVFLFGLPWIFGIFAYNVVAAYFFNITMTFQGFVLFIFFVVGNKKTRDLWLNKLKIKQTRKVPVTSSTYTNRSTGPGWRAGPSIASVEAKASKPRSLASTDDSNFS